MVVKRRGPQLPRPPKKVPVNPGAIGAIKQPELRLLLQQIQSRITEQDSRLSTLDTYALKAGSPVDGFGQRIINVGRPVEQDDAVPLWYMRHFIDTQAQLIARRGGGSGEGGEGGATGLDVPLPNLYQIVYDYAQAHPSELANSCLASGGTWDFMRGVVAQLQAADERIGWCGQRGNPSDYAEDAICYWGKSTLPPVNGETGNYVVDIISGHCGPSPGPTWNSVTPAGAVWLAVAP